MRWNHIIEVRHHVYVKWQTRSCSTWRSFPFTCRLLFIISKHKLVVSRHFLSIRIVLTCFCLLIFCFEKFSARIWRLPFAVYVKLKLSNDTRSCATFEWFNRFDRFSSYFKIDEGLRKVFICWFILSKDKLLLACSISCRFIVQQFVPVPIHWFFVRRSCIFNEDEVKLSLSTTKNNFALSLFLHLHHHHHHHISKLKAPMKMQTKKNLNCV